MHLDKYLISLLLTTVFSFLVGLEVKSYIQSYHKESSNYFFGSTRTFAFVGILGFIYFKINLYAYITLLVALTLLYAILYLKRVKERSGESIVLFLVLLMVYSLGPISITNPIWMTSLIFIFIIFILNAKSKLHQFSSYINEGEIETLGKMVLLSAVILPLLPNQKVIPYIPISPFKIWLAVVVVSAISYLGYISQKYIFPNRGYFLTGIIGGVYSSTATTVVLARKAKDIEKNPVINAAIIASTSVMYLRLIIVAAFFNLEVAKKLVLLYSLLFFIGISIAFYYLYKKDKRAINKDFVDNNPLELKTAFVFAILFIIMMVLTQYITSHYGASGLKIFSFLAGFTDVDPFVLSLVTGKYQLINQKEVIVAIMIATGSNNLLKAMYAVWFGSWTKVKDGAFWVFLLGVATIICALIL